MQINKSVIHNATKEVSLPRVWVPGAQVSGGEAG